MYSKDEAAKLKALFWTRFGQYIAPQLSADGEKANWVNYKTGVKHLYFRMEAGNKSASIGIEITHPDAGIQELLFEQLKELKALLRSSLDEDWEWLPHTRDENGKTISRVFYKINGVSVLDQTDWPALICFFKPRIIALDEFWSGAKYAFQGLK